jgi:methionyl-tRNA formyltransferase
MIQPLRLVFAGTPEFAVPHLQTCISAHVDIAAVYTQPDRPAGRGRQLTASAVKAAAIDAGLNVEQPETLREKSAQERLRSFEPDLLVVVAYGLILPRNVLAMPRLGCWNIHASLLPRWRGAAPIQRALLAGDTKTGVCLMQMEAGLDTGPVLIERAIDIDANDTAGSLHDRLAELGAQVLREGLQRAILGEPMASQAQTDEGTTYAAKLEKSEARLDWNDDALQLERKVRAFNPWPVAEAQLDGERVRIWSAHALAQRFDQAPGTIAAANATGIDVVCKAGTLRITELQRDGSRRQSVRDYLNARRNLDVAKS